ncbi:unnamed protein product, partial [Rodentolepis nana]|uniref:DUF115 domain-containing protein n=1 Tax=Rodentolepis nana TaxID=102285 RepID=A0A0R3TAK8_RODNA
VPFLGANEEHLIQGIEINIPLSCSTNETHTNESVCFYLQQTCSYITNERLPCGIHDFGGGGIVWSTTKELLKALKTNNAQWSSDLYKGRVYPLWLLPCEGKCSPDAICYWNEAELLRFSLKDNWNQEYLEGSGRPEEDYFNIYLGDVFISSISDSLLAKLQRHMRNNSILFVGDSTLRGLMYAFLRKLNGSLHFWEASHKLIAFARNNGKFYHKVGTEWNNPNEMIAFAYFPVFWQKRNNKINLTAFIDQSIKRFGLSRFDLVIGGTQWLNANQLMSLNDYLLRNKIRFNKETAEYEIEGEITEALLQDVHNLLNEEDDRDP